jgi:hypothetical protein
MKHLLAFYVLMMGISLRAEITVKEYQEGIADPRVAETIKTYITGLGTGMVYVEAVTKGTPLFCAPDKISINQGNFLEIINSQIKEREATIGKEGTARMVIGGILLKGLIETFPCAIK